MTGMDFPIDPINGQTTTDGRYYFDSSVGSTGAWRSAPLPVGGLPAGSIMAWGTNTPPANWLLADGSAVSRSTYSSLFAVIGTQYGAGNGTSTFNLPDLRGRVPVGRNGGTFGTLGATGGAETHTLTIAEMPSHTHNLRRGEYGNNRIEEISYSSGGNPNTASPTGIASTGGGGAHNNLQPYQVVNYIIKASAGWTAGDSELATRLGAVEQKQILSPNYVINGGFDIWQRGATFNSLSAYTYLADRWLVTYKDSGITLNASQQTFTPGSAPVVGNEGQYYLRLSNSAYTTGHTYYFAQKVEDVRTLAGQTVTLSYWARVSSGTLTPSRVFLNQNFGSGGSAEVDNIGATQPTYTTSWQRFSQTATLPSVAGKTIGSSSFVYVLWQITPNANVTLDLWGVQLEGGSQPTAFRRNSPNIQAELAACQRYYQTINPNGQGAFALCARAGSIWEWSYIYPIKMRAAPSGTVLANGSVWSYTSGAGQSLGWNMTTRDDQAWLTNSGSASHGAVGSAGVVDTAKFALNAEL